MEVYPRSEGCRIFPVAPRSMVSTKKSSSALFDFARAIGFARKPRDCWTSTDSDCSTATDSAESSDDVVIVPVSARRPSPSRLLSGRCNNVVIFDWDDTLSPTTHFKNMYALQPGLLHELSEAEALQMEEHARLVEAALRAAAAVAHVSILTLATQQWLQRSAASYLPALALARIVEELDVTVYFAQDELARCPGALERGLAGDLNAWVALKRSAMERCLRDWSAKGVLGLGVGSACCRKSVTSVGDGEFERRALRLLFREKELSASEAEHGRPLCNTVKLIDVPSAADLGSQLRHLPALIRHIAACDADFDLCVSSPNQLMAHRHMLEV